MDGRPGDTGWPPRRRIQNQAARGMSTEPSLRSRRRRTRSRVAPTSAAAVSRTLDCPMLLISMPGSYAPWKQLLCVVRVPGQGGRGNGQNGPFQNSTSMADALGTQPGVGAAVGGQLGPQRVLLVPLRQDR